MTTASTHLSVSTPEREAGEPRTGKGSQRRWVESGLVGFVVLTALYFALSLFASPDAYLSTDVGGKTGALAAMIERGDWSTDLGYWAEASDPEGLAYPFAHTFHTTNGWWVNTTSLPMVLAARPLWALGGPQLALLIPMMASAAAAVVAGRLQQRIHPAGGRSAMWVVGLSTPVAVYALDFWEHSLGVLLMGVGAILVLDAAPPDIEQVSRNSRRARPVLAALGAGLAFGVAATMRQEALVYGFVAGVVLTAAIVLDTQRPLPGFAPRRLLPSVAMAGGALAALAGNSMLEKWFYGEALRSARSAGAVSVAGTNLSERVDAMFTTTFSPINAIHPIATFFGLVIFVGLAWLMVTVRNGGDVRRPAILLVAIAAVLAMRVVQSGPSFVPGMVPTAPLVLGGLAFGLPTSRHRLVAAMALLPLPLIFLTQYAAGAVPQWGGRYLLATGFLLVVLACAVLPEVHPGVFRGLVVAGVLVTASGVWFNALRTTSLAEDFELIENVAVGDVVVWYDPVMAREAGPEIIEHRWLSTVGDAERERVLDVLSDEEIDRFVYVDPIDADPVVFDGFVAVSGVGEWELSTILRQRLTIFERR